MLPAKIKVTVKPYDEDHRSLLAKLAVWPKIEQLIANGLQIPREQFLVYSMFRLRDTQTLDDLQRRCDAQERMLDASLIYGGDSFSAHPKLDAAAHRPEAEVIGESLGLCFMDAVFDTHEADWKKIPEARSKTLDYTAGGSLRLELEAKGSFVVDRSQKLPAISNHRAGIVAKKSDAPAPPKSVRMGTIASVDRTSSTPMLWLLDPPADDDDRTPGDTRILHRMDFLAHIFSLLSPRSPLAAALATRLTDLSKVRDMSQLNELPLMSGRDVPLRFETDFGEVHSRFFATKSVVADGPAGGVIVKCSNDRMFLFGVQQSLLDLATAQSFEQLSAYREHPATVRKTVVAQLPRGRFKALGFDVDSRDVERSGGYCRFELKGDLHYSAGGLVFGWLPIPESIRQ